MLLLPLSLVEVYLFALGISLFLSAAFVKFRDVSYIWEVIMQAGFYITPIIYPVSKITNLTLQKILMLNPMAQAIQDARYWFIPNPKVVTTSSVFAGGWYQLIPPAVVVVVFVGGLTYFRRQSKYFAENV
jgi:ABC-2 type transport system permease protein